MTERKKITYQGEPGANSHLACMERYPRFTPVQCPTFEDAFDEVHSGKADLAMIPIENSVAGRVADVHRLLSSSRLQIVAEHFQPIRHHLLAPKGATLKTIKSVESHVMALGQCHKFLRKHNLPPIVTADTAKSAAEVAKSRNKARAAIASPLAAKIYGLKVLAQDVQDVAYNTTRFIVLAREKQWASHGKGPIVTTLMFEVRNIPGALYKALGGFATCRVNMTKLESYMEYGGFLATQFYADVEGHPDDAEIGQALEELKFFSKELRIFGVYPADPFRATFSGKARLRVVK
jgi:prephenate dehydratase